jgi:hypothetical protein
VKGLNCPPGETCGVVIPTFSLEVSIKLIPPLVTAMGAAPEVWDNAGGNVISIIVASRSANPILRKLGILPHQAMIYFGRYLRLWSFGRILDGAGGAI